MAFKIKKLTASAAFFVLSTLSFAGDPCASATSTIELTFCSAEIRKEADHNFNDELEKLRQSDQDKRLTKLRLLENYKSQKKFYERACSLLHPDGSSRRMYVNYCVAAELNLLSKSMKNFRCNHMNGENCD